MDDAILADARALLPTWVTLAPLLVLTVLALLLSATATAALNAAHLRAFLRLPTDAHWTERARLGYPARVGATLALIILPLTFAALASLFAGPLSAVPALALVAIPAAAALAAATTQRQRALRLLQPTPTPLRDRVRSAAAGLLFLYPHAFTLGLAAALCPDDLRWPTCLLLAASTTITLAVLRGLTLHLGACLGLARPADPYLHALIAEAAARTGQPPPRASFIIPWHAANAFALPFGATLAFTERLLHTLDDPQLIAVAAHELGHLAESRATIALRVATPLCLLPLVLTRPLFALSPWAAAAAILFVLLAVLASRRVFRRMEQHADDFGQQAALDPLTYAHALERLYEANAAPAVMPGNQRVHPHLYDRLLAAGDLPPWPRSTPPPRRPGLNLLLLLLAPILLTFALRLTLAVASTFATDRDDLLLLTAPWGGNASTLDALGRFQSNDADYRGAATLYRAALHLDPTDVITHASLAIVLGNDDHCDDARAELNTAFQLADLHPDAPIPPSHAQPFLDAAIRSVDACTLRSDGPE